MLFRTEYKTKTSAISLSLAQPVLLAGSCFSHYIGEKMRSSFWKAINATGTLFNPESIARVLELMLLSEQPLSEYADFIFCGDDGVYRNWLFDSRVNSENPQNTLSEFLRRKEVVENTLKKGGILIVTFGTSIIYQLRRDQTVVGNCHKQPDTLFIRKCLKVDEIVERWVSLIKELRAKYKELKVILTVSPVRHLRDGFEGNSRSKAILLLAVEEICSKLENVIYFPAYEIVIDDLRDYRFYAEDMVHPSEQAVEYIWEKFQDTFINSGDRELLKKGEKIAKGLKHRSLLHNKGENINLQLKELERKNKLKKEYENLKNQYPELLRFDYPFETDPGF